MAEKMQTNLIEFNRKFKAFPDHNDKRYEFHPDWDIGIGCFFIDWVSESRMKELFANEVATYIPPEYRDKIEYICKPVPKHHNGRPPFHGGWFYPGKKLFKENT